MAAVNPSESAQPSLDQVYETEGNPATKEPAQEAKAQENKNDDSPLTDQRIPQKQTTSMDEATPTSMARGTRGAGEGEDPSGLSAQERGEGQEVNADQMGAPGEDKVADAVKSTDKPGAGGKEPGTGDDLDRKKAEQAGMREEMKKKQQSEVDQAGATSHQGGPANPVDKAGYPNKGS